MTIRFELPCINPTRLNDMQLKYLQTSSRHRYQPTCTWAMPFGDDENVEKSTKVESGSCIGCVGSSCEGIDSSRSLSLQCKLCMDINDVYHGKSQCFFMFALNRSFVFVLIVPFNIWTLFDFQGIQRYMVRNMGHFTNSKCWVASLITARRGSQPSSCSQLADHTQAFRSFFQVNVIGQRTFFRGDKTRHFLVHQSFLRIVIIYKTHMLLFTPTSSPLEIAHLTCFKILRIHPSPI
jgi:hypothetical protein